MKLYLLNVFQNWYNRFESWKITVRDWFTHYAETPHAERWLAFFSFIESSFFPIPPDFLLSAMTLAHRHRWARYALITALFSVLGGLFGYFIGVFFFDFVGVYIINLYHLEEEVARVAELFKDNAFVALFVAAFTPIPYKVFTIAAGFFSVNLFVFIAASIFGRATRFFIVSYLVKRFGERFGYATFRYFDLVTFLLLLLALLSLYLIARIR